MTRNCLRSAAVVVAAFAFPIAALADFNGTGTLNTGDSFSFSAGAKVSSGGDITFTGSSITYVGSAKGGILPGLTGSALFSQLNYAELAVLASQATAAPIPTSSLTAGTSNGSIVALIPNNAEGAVLLVTALSSSSISFQFTTFGLSAPTGGGGGPAAPTVTSVQSWSTNVVSGFPNYAIAPGSLVSIYGSNMASATTGSNQSTASPGLPNTLNGATVKITIGGQSIQPALYYATASLINFVLPSSTPTGTASLTVSYNNQTSTAVPFPVVASAPGFIAYTGNQVVATDVSGNIFSYTNSAKPGQTIIIWGAGLGASTASDTTYDPNAHAVNAALTIYIGGLPAAISYQGSGLYPGVNIFTVTVPQAVQPGCAVSVIGSVGTFVSNSPTIAIAPNGGICSDPNTGLTGTQYNTLTGQTNVKSGFVGVIQSTSSGTTLTEAIGSFSSVTSSGFSVSGSGGTASVGSCVLLQTVGSATGSVTSTPLNPGTLTVNGPGGSATLTSNSLVPGIYFVQIPAIPSTGGTYSFTATGGSGTGAVGPFTTSATFPNPILNWTNQSAAASITRSSGLPVTWTGGAPGTYVTISGSSSSGNAYVTYTCIAPQSALQFNVPAYILNALPAGSGSTTVTNASNYQTFTATGLDYGFTYGGLEFSVTSTYK